MYKPILYSILLSLILFGNNACNDDETEIKPYPYKAITSFTVTNAGQTLRAALYQDTILLYWPPATTLPESITPSLTVSEHATVTPPSGQAIPLNGNVTYTVTAEDKSTATYTLKVVVTQPQPVMTTYFNDFEIGQSEWNIGGFSHLIPDTSFTRLFAIAADGTAKRIPLATVKNSVMVAKQLTTAILDTGTYKLRVETGIYKITSSQPLIRAFVRPYITEFSPAKGKAGTEVTLTGTNFHPAAENNIVKFGDKQADVLSASPTTLIVTVPEDAATGMITVITANGRGGLSTTPFTVLTDNQTVVTTYAGTAMGGYLDGDISTAQFKPYGALFDAAGNMYVADYGNHCIRKITPGGKVSTVAGNPASGNADGTGTAAQFKNPQSIAIDETGNLYVADGGNHRIRKITPTGEVTTVAGSTMGYADGTGTAAKFNSPRGVAIDTQGNLYVADYNNFRIRKITPDGVVTTFAGSGTPGYTDNTGTNAAFGYISRIAIDKTGILYVSDGTNNAIRKITTDAIVSTYAGTGTAGYLDGPATAAQFASPLGIAVDREGNVYVGDNSNNRIRQITPEGVVNTYAGSGTAGFADGPGNETMFRSLQGLAVDAQGNVYAADYSNFRIRKIIREE